MRFTTPLFMEIPSKLEENLRSDLSNTDHSTIIIQPELTMDCGLAMLGFSREVIVFDPTQKYVPTFNPLAGPEYDVGQNITVAFKQLHANTPVPITALSERLIDYSIKVLKRLDAAEGVEGKHATLINLSRLLQNNAGIGRGFVNKFSRINCNSETQACENRDIAAWFLNYRTSGRRIYAIGTNVESAKVAGIKEARVRFLAFVISGALAGLAGMLFTSNYASCTYSIGDGYELQAIAICILGGVSITGGRGTVDGVFIGWLMMSVITQFISLLPGLSVWQKALQGAIIIAAVFLNIAMTRSSEKRFLKERGALL